VLHSKNCQKVTEILHFPRRRKNGASWNEFDSGIVFPRSKLVYKHQFAAWSVESLGKVSYSLHQDRSNVNNSVI